MLDYPSAQALADELWAYRLPDLPPDPPVPPVPAARKRISAAQRGALWERDQGRYGLCGQPVAYDDAVIDHIQPVAHGGLTAPENLEVAHPSCNAYKTSSPNPAHWQARVRALKAHGPPAWVVVEDGRPDAGSRWQMVLVLGFDPKTLGVWRDAHRVVAVMPTHLRALRMVWRMRGGAAPCRTCGVPLADHLEDGSCPE